MKSLNCLMNVAPVQQARAKMNEAANGRGIWAMRCGLRLTYRPAVRLTMTAERQTLPEDL